MLNIVMLNAVMPSAIIMSVMAPSDVCLFVHLSVHSSVHLFICLSICPFVLLQKASYFVYSRHKNDIFRLLKLDICLYREYLNGKYHCTVDLLFDWFGISCMTTDIFCIYFQNRLIQTSQTGGQPYSDTSPFSIPWSVHDCLT